jgi:hypothetical protein
MPTSWATSSHFGYSKTDCDIFLKHQAMKNGGLYGIKDTSCWCFDQHTSLDTCILKNIYTKN